MNTSIITQNETKVANRPAFLNALYQTTPENLYLEIRCIHPITAQVRSLWSPIGDEVQRNRVLEQANQLNREGYGIYFAPCLRREQKGSAEYAAVATALWVDIDCDDELLRRDKALSKLESFQLMPSAVIDSGGGWHGYWLLEEPYQLDSDEHRKHIALILQGLFTALDGDEGYVKSVASVMRLPDSINTKPERGGVVSTIKCFNPERRYMLDDFAWLKLESPKVTTKSTILIDGKYPLPQRTQDYLSSGSSDGSRNNDLFAAACQMRDAGYSQAEAERQLVARYLADSSAGENASGREKEAIKTIASVYSQPAREPVSSRQVALQKVTELVEQYGSQQKDVKRPSVDELSDVITECAETMNALQWAEQRDRFKSFTGDGLRISDIDRVYREKRKAVERESQQNYIETECYFVSEEKMVYRKDTYKGPLEKTVADWTATVLYQTCQIDDDGQENHVTKVELKRASSTKVLEIPGDIFVDDVALRRFIGTNAGIQFIVRAGMSKHLVPAIIDLSGEFETHRHFNFMGWRKLDDRWAYVTPRDSIRSTGKMSEPPSVELDHRLREYGLTTSSWEDSADALKKMIAVLPPQLAPALISYALLPLVYRFMPSAAPKPAMQLVGTSGSGKSEIAALMNSFYGDFSRDTPPAQWGDTINTVEVMGYPLADALYWVDDYKDIYADKRTFTRFMQSYSRKMGRGRLTREAKVRTERQCRGFLLSTGETTLEGEMSVVARMFNLEIPPWEHRDPDGQALAEAEAVRQHLSGLAAHFASWIARQIEQGDLEDDLANRFSGNVAGIDARLTTALGKKEANSNRVTKNWAVLITVYQLLARFTREKDADELLPAWQDVAVESVKALREERASEVFLDNLGQLLGGGQVVIDTNMRQPNDYPSGVTVIGYKEGRFVYLLPDIALREVNKLQPMHFTTTAIGMQLKEGGILIPGSSGLTTQKRVRGSRVRFWQLTAESLLETVETPETTG